jgi:hypothetical protein
MMATGTSRNSKPVSGLTAISGRKKLQYGLIAFLVLFLLWLLFNFADLKANARLGSAYAAHVACSCRYIEGHSLDACYKNFEPGMGMVSLADDPENKRVSASVPLLAHAVAERRGDFGCQQLNEKEIDALD